jgi:hypothetical protein
MSLECTAVMSGHSERALLENFATTPTFLQIIPAPNHPLVYVTTSLEFNPTAVVVATIVASTNVKAVIVTSITIVAVIIATAATITIVAIVTVTTNVNGTTNAASSSRYATTVN